MSGAASMDLDQRRWVDAAHEAKVRPQNDKTAPFGPSLGGEGSCALCKWASAWERYSMRLARCVLISDCQDGNRPGLSLAVTAENHYW